MNFRDKKGCNGLHYAACAGSIEFIEKAVGNGIDPDCIDSYGWTALHWAAASFGPTTGAIKSLLKTGANRTLRDEEGRTPLDLALMFRKPTEATILRSEEPLPENIPVYDFGEATRQKYAWESEQNCHGCGDVSIHLSASRFCLARASHKTNMTLHRTAVLNTAAKPQHVGFSSVSAAYMITP
jgi:hypothetical protein